jgi:hypothetical protein
MGLVPCPLRQVLIGFGSTWKDGAGALLQLVLQLRNVMMFPELT